MSMNAVFLFAALLIVAVVVSGCISGNTNGQAVGEVLVGVPQGREPP